MLTAALLTLPLRFFAAARIAPPCLYRHYFVAFWLFTCTSYASRKLLDLSFNCYFVVFWPHLLRMGSAAHDTAAAAEHLYYLCCYWNVVYVALFLAGRWWFVIFGSCGLYIVPLNDVSLVAGYRVVPSMTPTFLLTFSPFVMLSAYYSEDMTWLPVYSTYIIYTGSSTFILFYVFCVFIGSCSPFRASLSYFSCFCSQLWSL
jgi:hypothetical protein